MSPVLSLRILGTAGLTLFVAAAFTPLPHALSRRLALASSLEPAGAIVVLGGGGVRHDGSLTDISLRRTVYGLDLYRRGLAPLLVFSGSASRHGYVEAEIRAELARACGVPPVAILAQPEGHTTSDEASRVAALRMTEIVGTALLFVTVNLAVGVATILALRVAAGWFLSVYFLNDLSLLVLSGLQALLVDSWRHERGRDQEPLTSGRVGEG